MQMHTEGYPYQKKQNSIDVRVEDLISRMTLNQKIRQLTCLMVTGNTEAALFHDGIGQVIYFNKSKSPKETAETHYYLQRQIMEQTEWKIPAIFHAEALSGVVTKGCAVFPSPLALGAAFDPELVEDIAASIRKQMLNMGLRQALSPVLDLARDFRWGRTNEDYGSDPTLVSVMACAFVSGLQGENLQSGVAATGKHLIGYSMPEGGLNMARSQTDWRDIRENYAKPFEATIHKANLKAVMNSYSEYNGKEICASKEILTDLLRDDFGFQGLVVSDYNSIRHMVINSKTAENMTDAAIQSLYAGLDMELPNPVAYNADLREAVKKGLVREEIADRSLRRVLTLKFELGLFDEPFRTFEEQDNAVCDRKAQIAAEKAITLTKNDQFLPLTNRSISVAVIGPTGNSIRLLNGSYTFPAFCEMQLGMAQSEMSAMQDAHLNYNAFIVTKNTPPPPDRSAEVDAILRKEHMGMKTIFEAVRDLYPNTQFVKGCDFWEEGEWQPEAALKAASQADVVILAVGGKNGWGPACVSGEGLDNVDITLPGRQCELIERIFQVNSNIVLIHTDHKPLVFPFAYEKIPAIVEAWLPGLYGGNAIANVIAGEVNPSGKLPVDIPRHVGQTPVYYYQHNNSRSDAGSHGVIKDGYRSCSSSAQLPFGFGLSYTEFEYTNGKLETKTIQQMPYIKLSIDVKNVGAVCGEEVVQLYGIDEVASYIRPQKELLGFKRVPLRVGESKRVSFLFRMDQLAFPDSDNIWHIEKGTFLFFIGKGCNERVYEATYLQRDTMVIDHTKRGFWAQASVEG